MARKVGGTSSHGHKKHVSTPASKKYTPPPKTNTSKHPKVYRPKQNYTTTPATKTTPAHTTGTVGASYGVTQKASDRDLQNKQRLRTINLAHKLKFAATKPITATHAIVHPIVPPSVQAAVHSTVGYVRGQINQPASAAQVYQGGSGVQPHIYYGTNPNTGETKRFDLGKGTLNLQTRQALTEAGWTNISQQPPQTPPDSSYTWSQSQNTFVKKNTTQVQSQGGGWDSWLPW